MEPEFWIDLSDSIYWHKYYVHIYKNLRNNWITELGPLTGVIGQTYFVFSRIGRILALNWLKLAWNQGFDGFEWSDGCVNVNAPR